MEVEMKRFMIFTRALGLIHLRNRVVLFWNLAFPVLMLVLYGVIFNNGGFGGGDVSYIDWVLPGVLVFNALSFGLITSSSMMLTMRENGVLRRLQATPMPAGQLVGSYLLVNVTIVLLQSLIIIGAAVLLFGANVTAPGLLLALPMILAGVVTFVALGQVVSGLAPTAGAAVIAGQLLYFGMMFTTDLIFPVESLPDWLQKVAVYLPSYPVVRLIRPPLLDGALGGDVVHHLGIAALYTAVAAVVAARLFRWSPRS
jgi:ABC-2 type transport system permease protein